MPRTLSLVQRVEIASPCPAKWDEMVGDDRSRFCAQCKLNVYDLSAMSEAEAERLIVEKEGRLCARIFRRADGTILTRECPVGLAATRRHAVRLGLKAAAMIGLIISLGATLAFRRDPNQRLRNYPRLQPTAYGVTRDKARLWTQTSLPPLQMLPRNRSYELGRMALPVQRPTPPGCTQQPGK